jgi:hypothetical protein
MITISGTNADHDVGELTADLSVSGTNSTVRGTIPDGHAVNIDIMGTNADLFIGGKGSLTLSILGTNCTAVVAPEINATIQKSGTNTEIKRESVPEDKKTDGKAETAVSSTNVSVNAGSQVNVTSEGKETSESFNVDNTGTGTPNSTAANDQGSDNQVSSTEIYKRCTNCGFGFSEYNDPEYCPECGVSTTENVDMDTEIYDP